MQTRRISASSYSNTAPLVWSFLYGSRRGEVEIILDTAPARSAELLAEDRVDAALVPVFAYQMIEGVKLVPDVCVGATERVRSVCLITRGCGLEDVRSVSLDVSSRTSAALTKIIFREFLTAEPEWRDARPNIDEMLANSDAALLIGDPSLRLSSVFDGRAEGHGTESELRVYDLAALWRRYTGLGFVFAMWMTRRGRVEIDLAGARDEGLAHADEIALNYEREIGLAHADMVSYLTESVSYSVDESMRAGMELYFALAAKHGLIARNRPIDLI